MHTFPLLRTVVAAALVSVALAGGASALEVGQKAPDFTLNGAGGKPVKLTDLTAKGPVVLYTFIAGLHQHLNEGNSATSRRPCRSSKPRAPRSWASAPTIAATLDAFTSSRAPSTCSSPTSAARCCPPRARWRRTSRARSTATPSAPTSSSTRRGRRPLPEDHGQRARPPRPRGGAQGPQGRRASRDARRRSPPSSWRCCCPPARGGRARLHERSTSSPTSRRSRPPPSPCPISTAAPVSSPTSAARSSSSSSGPPGDRTAGRSCLPSTGCT